MPSIRPVTISTQSIFLDTRMSDGLVRAYHARNRQLASGAPGTFDPVEPVDIPEEFYRATSLQRRQIMASRYGWLANPSWLRNVSVDGCSDNMRSTMLSQSGATSVLPVLRYLTWWYFRDGAGTRPSNRLPLYDSRTMHSNAIIQAIAAAAEEYEVPVEELEPMFSAFLPHGEQPVQSILDMLRATRRQPFSSSRNLYAAARDASISQLNLALVLTGVPEFSSDTAVASHFGAQADNIPRGMTLNAGDVGKVFFFSNGGAFRFSAAGEDRHDLLRVMHPVYTGDAAGQEPRVLAPATDGPAVVSYSSSALSHCNRYWRFATEAEIEASIRRSDLMNGWYCMPQTNGGSTEDLMHNLGLASPWSTSYSAGCRLTASLFPNATSRDAAPTPAAIPVPERSEPSPTVRSDVQPVDSPAPARTTRVTINPLAGFGEAPRPATRARRVPTQTQPTSFDVIPAATEPELAPADPAPASVPPSANALRFANLSSQYYGYASGSTAQVDPAPTATPTNR